MKQIWFAISKKSDQTARQRSLSWVFDDRGMDGSRTHGKLVGIENARNRLRKSAGYIGYNSLALL